MSVVHRCPSCGTTQAGAGACDACHEAQVRYFCTNHTPGLWLDAERCPTCGARLGDAARSAAPPRAPAPPPVPRAAPASTRAVDREARMRRPGAPEAYLAPAASRLALWQRIFQTVARAYALRATMLPPPRASRGRGLGGCLLRLLLVAAVLFLALSGTVVMFGLTLF